MAEEKKPIRRYYWLKLDENFFTQPKIKKLRRIAGGDTYTVIYLKLQLLSLKQDGTLFFEGIEDDFIEELALTIDEEIENVRFTVLFLISQKLLIEVKEDEFFLPETKELIGGESLSAQRVREFRKRQKGRKSVTCNTSVTKRNTYIEGENNKNTDNKEYIEEIFEKFKEICTSLPVPYKLTDKRRSTIKARLKEYSKEQITEVFELAEKSDFLTGKETDWNASFDWILNPSNFVKILEGNYKNKEKKSTSRYSTSSPFDKVANVGKKSDTFEEGGAIF